MSTVPVTVRQLLKALGEMPLDGVYDVTQNTRHFDYSAQVRGFLVLKRAGIVKEVTLLVFRLLVTDLDAVRGQLEKDGVDLDAPLSQQELGGGEISAVYAPSIPPPPAGRK
jgi:hypothetical protein